MPRFAHSPSDLTRYVPLSATPTSCADACGAAPRPADNTIAAAAAATPTPRMYPRLSWLVVILSESENSVPALCENGVRAVHLRCACCHDGPRVRDGRTPRRRAADAAAVAPTGSRVQSPELHTRDRTEHRAGVLLQ